MVAENPTWGAPRIHGELKMLGFDLSERTVLRWMRKAPKAFLIQLYAMKAEAEPSLSVGRRDLCKGFGDGLIKGIWRFGP